MQQALFYNLHKPPEAIVTEDRGLWYGEGFFETIRYHEAQAPLWKYHLDRIQFSADYLDFEIDMNDLATFLLKEVEPLATSKINLAFCMAGSSGYSRSGQEQLRIYFRQEAISPQMIPSPMHISTSQEVRLTAGQTYTRLKSISALAYTIAAKEKKQKGVDEQLLLNQHGHIVEAIASNIFVLKNDKWLTPPLTDGGVAGVFRAMILDSCLPDTVDIQEKSLDLKEILDSDGLVLTNALRGAMVVGSIDGHTLPTEKSNLFAIKSNEIAGFIHEKNLK